MFSPRAGNSISAHDSRCVSSDIDLLMWPFMFELASKSKNLHAGGEEEVRQSSGGDPARLPASELGDLAFDGKASVSSVMRVINTGFAAGLELSSFGV